jgi:hypothetical protein
MFVLGALLGFSTATAFGQEAAKTATTKPDHAVAGDLEKVADDGKTITVKTVDGTEEVFKFSGKATVKASDEGSHVVVHYTEKGAEKTAHAVKVAGKGTWKATEGTVTAVGKGGREVTVKAADGTEKTFDLGKDATVDTGKGLYDGSKYVAKAGDKVVLYTTVEPGKEIVHLFKKL